MIPQVVRCGGCATELAPGLLSCPSCARLVHAARLTELAAEGSAAEAAQEWTRALTAWREAVMLLPDGSRQKAAAEEKVRALSARVGNSASADPRPWWKKLTALGPAGILLAFLGKAKLLLLGFTKLGTLLTFVAGLSIYWTIWGWQFALCFLLSIYIHEMGHVNALRRYGIPASAPMFIPGLGALVRLKQNPASPQEDARVGLAGPIWGLGACLASLALLAYTRNPFWGGVARAGAWINLFNLIPVWQLDGSRGLRSLGRAQTWMLAVLSAVMWMVVSDGLPMFLAILLAIRAIGKRDDEGVDEDWTGFAQFAGLIVTLSLLCLIPVPKGK
jgi:Zn-dependent protease